MTKLQRLQAANEFIRVIASCGREFFKHEQEIARLELSPTSRVFFHDEYSKKRIYTHLEYRRWEGFSHGGTLKRLIIALKNFITKDRKLRAAYFNNSSANPWGYGEDILIVKESAIKLGIAE